MNFARHQAQADRTADRLIWLHALASLAVVFGVNAAAALIWQLLFGAAPYPKGFFLTNTLVVTGLIVGGAWIETARLRDDGALIARRLGAVPVDPINDPLHRRLQNLLEELAIAARIGVPRAFVLEDEPSINALTAGLDRNRAVVVASRGALERLTRDELQGVMAHEVSHIVNGDVRLNTRLVGLNHGLNLVAQLGYSLLARARRGAADAGPDGLLAVFAMPMALMGGVLAGVGALGVLAARAIEAGVGRQREFFADAQAIEFTRSRDGLGGALRKIAGFGRVLPANAEDDLASPIDGPASPVLGRDAIRRDALRRHPYLRNLSHLMLVGTPRSDRWFATHPPLRERVRRIYGRHRDAIAPVVLPELDRREPALPVLDFESTGMAWIAGHADMGEPFDQPPPTAAMRLVQATRDPTSSAALVIAMLQLPGQEPSEPRWGDGWSSAAARHAQLRQALGELPMTSLRPLQWPLLELAVARLRMMSASARQSLLDTARGVVVADGRVTLREWIYFTLLRVRLMPRTRQIGRSVTLEPIAARSIRVLFGLLAASVDLNEARADRAANASIRALGLASIGGSSGALTLEALEHAVAQVSLLPPLAKPLLVRHLVEMLPGDAGIEPRDFLRVLCVVIDCPPPQLPERRLPERPLPEPSALSRQESPSSPIDSAPLAAEFAAASQSTSHIGQQG
jgi:Zn-dependent protease with chaperone function